MNRCNFLLIPLLGLLWLSMPAQADIWLIDVKGAIGPATADHMVRGLGDAEQASAELIILRLDTPGGLDSSMRIMIRAILASSVPVVAYVAPGGARAASAGTYLLYASHIAVMAPATNLGAATPVQIGSPGLPEMPGSTENPESGKEAGLTAMERKAVNDAVAYIQSLAQLRDRNIEWAERAVRKGESLSAEDALAAGVINLIAGSLDELLSLVHGTELSMEQGSITLLTEGLEVYIYPLDWRSELLAIITDPNVAYILMLLGIYGLLLEFYSPGMGIGGIVGGICLLLALYAFQVLPISYAGLALMLLGIALMIGEAFAPSFGVLGLGGIAAFIMGSLMLMDTDMPAYQIALPTVIAVSVFSAALLMVSFALIMRARKQQVVSGVEHLLGAAGIVEKLSGAQPMVRLEGELWEVRCAEPLVAEDEVVVCAIDGVTLEVKKQARGNQDGGI